MSTSYCTPAAPGHAQHYCSPRKNQGPSLCDSVYNPRQENQRVACDNEIEKEISQKIDAPVGIYDVNANKIDLPPLCWTGYETTPKCLTMRNTGRTVMINGHWGRGRPYLTGGPLNGTYIFSQIHFHCPSEHQINGIRYPLEMHVVHYKTTYLTQEKAMYEKDGTIVLVYLFQVKDGNATQLNQISKAITCIDVENTSIDLPKCSLDSIITPFMSNYYLYWGSVNTEKNSYLLQWFVCRKIGCVSRGEVNNLFKVMDSLGSPCGFTRMKPENGEVFHVEDDDSGSRSKSKTSVKRSDECKKTSSVQTCKSLSSLKSLCLRKSNSCCEKLNGKEGSSEAERPGKHVKISTVDGSTNTTPKASKNDVSKSKKSVKVTEKDSDCDSNSTAKDTKKKEGTKEEKSSKGKKDAKTKEKKSKKDDKSCEKVAKAVCQSSSSCKSLLTDELHKSGSTADTVCDAVDDIKTLYEKKQKGKKKTDKKDNSKGRKDADKNEDIQVNFLLTPNAICSNYSNAVDSVGSKMLEIKDEEASPSTPEEKISKHCLSIPTQILIKRNSTSDTHLPATNAENESKEFCLMMEHLFRSDNNKKTSNKDKDKDRSWNFQEYHVAIEYDHNILQEYNGILQPDQLSLGNYEKLNLVPKYEDSKDLHIALTDCSIKLENTEDIRIRAKFMVKENALSNALASEKRGVHDSQNLLDAGTQYTAQEVELVSSFKPENIISSESDMEEYIKCQITKLIGEGKSSFKINNLREELKEELHTELRDELRSKLQQELREEFLQKDIRTEGHIIKSISGNSEEISSSKEFGTRQKKTNEKPIESHSIDPIEVFPSSKIIENSKLEYLDINKSKSKGDQLTGSRTKDFLNKNPSEKVEQDSTKRMGNFSRHSSASSNTSSSKTTYFIYDRIEKDANTGKKIFVGSFRTKEGTNEAQIDQTPSLTQVEKIETLQKCSTSRDMGDFTSDMLPNEKLENNENDAQNVGIRDILSQDSDLVKIDTWCNEQLDDVSQKTQIIPDARPELNPDSNESLTLHKCRTENFDERKKQYKGKGKKLSVGKVSSPTKSPGQHALERPTTSSVAGSKRELFKRNKTDKNLTSSNALATKSAAASAAATSTNVSDSKKGSKTTKTNTDKSVTNVQNKSTSFQWEDFNRKENRIEPTIRSNSSKSRISSRSGKSRGTVVVIPIEVESLSKIELILVEHTDDRSDKTEHEYIPCLNCYKC